MSSKTYSSCYPTDEESSNVKPWAHRQNYDDDDDIYKRTDLVPEDSVSIVAIEQVLPKLHQCSKGEGCHKWQKQQYKLARLAQDLPFEHFGSGRIVAGDPGNPKTAPNLLMSPKSELTPSLTASSDILGHGKLSAFQLSQEKLRELKPRDPQENVRNFLNFQSLDRLQIDNQPATPPAEFVSLSESESCDSAKITPTLSEHLRHLPRLRIPSMHDSSDGSVFTESIFTTTENTSALRTVTPSILSRRNHFNDRTAVPGEQELISREVAPSPADYYRVDPYYRSETPLSEVDAPITAVPIGPVSREDSQSVPPNMRFGNNRHVMQEPITRPSSTMVERHWRSPSIQSVTALNPLKEGYAMSPIETPEDLRRTPRGPQFRNNTLFPSTRREQGDVTHSGWMKKRKTTKLLRHDWEDHHFTLKGTQLSMHDDIASAHRNSQALEHIDVDNYAVACSSHASKSKLTAAFKKTVLKRNDNPQDVSAFSFSLIPTPNGSSFVDRKTMFLNSGKSHHFAVKSRDERIDWMRELMLAKALKRGRDSGAELTFNGANMI
ncbi:Sterile alpha motif, type 2 [Penicillium expansum]|nr:Sterile alpha motif, type 2 [Penicillium expansum]